MIEALARRAADAEGRARLRAQLLWSPHVWPPPGSAGPLAWAQEVAGLEAPPAMVPGLCPVVTVNGPRASLWMLDARTERRGRADPRRPDRGPRVAGATLGPRALDAWRAAGVALARSLPVLWQPVRVAAETPPVLIRVETLADQGVAASERVVDGPSIGLACCLALASRVLDVPLPDDVVASASLDASGRLGPVDGLGAKARSVEALAPRVTRLIVVVGQEETAYAALAGLPDRLPLRVVGVRSAAEALDQVFGPGLADLLVEQGRDAARRAELVASFFRLALGGRGAAIDWTPIEQGARRALERWEPVLSQDQAFELGFAAAVAARHERNAGGCDVPTSDWLAARPLPIRLAVVTHLVQHAADVGEPAGTSIERVAQEFRAGRLPDAFLPQLKLEGALARLWAVTGRTTEALAAQATLAPAFAALFEYAETSFPLSEWFRLAGALGRPEAFAEAAALHARVVELGGLGAESAAYVDLSRARAMVMLGLAEGSDPIRPLVALAERGDVPSHVRWSAARWALGAGARSAAARIEHELRQTAAGGGRDAVTAQKFVALVDLDRTVRTGRLQDARGALAGLQSLEPGLIRHLARWSPAGDALAGHVARFYPY